MADLTIGEIFIRLTLSIAFGGIIGFERQYKNRPAGIRTHILVCIGATIIALIQSEIAANALNLAMTYPKLTGVVRADEARLIAQVVSGIGFLGAGTIIVTKQSVVGLTTAASLWACAGLGIATGMGYYDIAVAGFIAIMFSLTLVKRIVKVPKLKKLEVQYVHRIETKEFLNAYFDKHHIEIEDVIFDVYTIKDKKIYKNVFTIDLPKELTYADVIEELSMHPNMMKVRMVALAE